VSVDDILDYLVISLIWGSGLTVTGMLIWCVCAPVLQDLKVFLQLESWYEILR
jgi:uncharacterized membrane protein YhdT